MDFALSANQESIRDAVGKICARFDDAYWLKKDKEGGFPADFHMALADAGWLGICIPEEFGGSGLGITDAADEADVSCVHRHCSNAQFALHPAGADDGDVELRLSSRGLHEYVDALVDAELADEQHLEWLVARIRTPCPAREPVDVDAPRDDVRNEVTRE